MIGYRLMEPADMDGVIALLWAFHSEGWFADMTKPDEAFVRQSLATVAGSGGSQGVIVVAFDDDGIIGAASAVAPAFWFAPQDRFAIEQFIYVKKDRRVGVGRSLVRALEAFLTCLNFKGLFLLSGDGDPRAGSLFQRMGYASTATMHFKALGV